MGTDAAVAEAHWLELLRQTSTWEVPNSPTVIVAPHPDDETLGAGGLIAAQRSRGFAVRVAAVTDGEKAYSDVPGLAAMREREQTDALQRLSVPTECITRFRLPDGNVACFETDLGGAADAFNRAGHTCRHHLGRRPSSRSSGVRTSRREAGSASRSPALFLLLLDMALREPRRHSGITCPAISVGRGVDSI